MKKITEKEVMNYIINSMTSHFEDHYYNVWYNPIDGLNYDYESENNISVWADTERIGVDFSEYENVECFEKPENSDFQIVCEMLADKLNSERKTLYVVYESGQPVSWIDSNDYNFNAIVENIFSADVENTFIENDITGETL